MTLKASNRTAIITANEIGLAPVGSIIAYAPGYFGAANNGGGWTVVGPATNTVADMNTHLSSQGWIVCDGTAPSDAESPIFNTAGRHVPDMTGSRFLQGNTSAGTTGGSNTQIDHTHGFGLTAAGQGGGAATTGSQSVNHSHGGTTDNAGSHKHNIQYYTGASFGAGTIQVYADATPGTKGSEGVDSDGSHTHTFGTGIQSASHTHTQVAHTHNASGVSGTIGSGSVATSTNSRPLYLSAFYIIRIK